MNQFDDLLSVGKEMMDAVNQAIEGNDYSSLKRNLDSQMVNLTEELNKYNARNNTRSANRRTTSRTNTSSTTRQVYSTSTTRTIHSGTQTNNRPEYLNQNTTVGRSSNRYTPFKQTNPSYAGSVLKLIGGIIGLCTFAGILVSASILFTIFGGAASIPSFIIALVGTLGSGYLTVKSVKERKLLDKFYKYAKIVGTEEYITVSNLANMANETESQVVENLEEMMLKGFLPKARLDAGKTTLMLTNDVYKQYIKTAEQKLKEEQKKSAADQAIDNLNVSKEVKEIIRNGNSFVDKIQTYNDAIPDESMTSKLDELKSIVDRIFKQVKKNPTSAGDMRKLMNYYLPTTDKLLTAYIDLDKQPERGNVADTKKEIEDAIDTINVAFNNLFDSMFQDVAWDISSDISAMKTMMAQDGLTDAKNSSSENKKQTLSL